MATMQGSPAGRQRSNKRWLALLLGLVAIIGGVVLYLQVVRPRLTPTPVQTLVDIPLSGGTSRFDYQSIDPQRNLLFIAHLGASTVTVFDLTTQKVVAEIPGISQVHGVLAVPELGKVYAAATGDNQIAVIDEQSLKVVAKLSGGNYPDGLAFDPTTRKVFVSDESGGTDTVIDTLTEKIVATIPLGGEAGNTYYDLTSHHMFVAVQTLNQLVEIDPATHGVVGHTPVPGCQHAHSLLIDAPNRLAFVGCEGNAKMAVIDMNDMNIISLYDVGRVPDVFAFDPGWHRLYVASEGGVLSIFEERGRTVQKVSEGFVAASAHSVAVDPKTHHLYLPLQDVDGKPVLRIAMPPAP